MPLFYIQLDDPGREAVEQELEDAVTARNAALIVLANELQANPNFAAAGHWRADLLDADRRLLAHIIVATVPAAPPINWSSFNHGGKS